MIRFDWRVKVLDNGDGLITVIEDIEVMDNMAMINVLMHNVLICCLYEAFCVLQENYILDAFSLRLNKRTAISLTVFF